MQWLNQIVDAAIARQPEGEILVSSGASPSGTYHFGHLRELITCDAIVLELRRRGREARHVHFVDDLDGLRKIPGNIPQEYEQYLGIPLCDIPAPDGSDRSYANYFLDHFVESIKALGIEFDVIYSHEKYRSGFFVPAIERSLSRIPEARKALETVSQRKLDDHWSPIQVMDKGRLKNRTFLGLDTAAKTVRYEDADGNEQVVRYDAGEVKLDWRLDWPGRWWLLNVVVEPFGRDHATKGGSYDTGMEIMKDVYEAAAPIPVPYDFVNKAGDNKKMSASRGTGIDAHEAVKVLPAEVARFFMLQYPNTKRLYFDQADGVIKLVDEFAALAAKPERTESEEQLLYLCTRGLDHKTVSRVPFSHLVASYQASLKDAELTIEVIKRTEHSKVAEADADIIRTELTFIDEWLNRWAPEDVQFALAETVDPENFTEQEQTFLKQLAEKVAAAPADADGAWFHNAIYEFKESLGMAPKEMFTTLYRALINKTSGPRAGWFLSILPREWLIERLRLLS
jgi:lysyl-tRNA synthetase class 1